MEVGPGDQCRCGAPIDCAVRTYVANRGAGGLTAQVYQFVEDAPASAEPYCVACAQRLMFDLAGLCNTDDALTYGEVRGTTP